MKPSNLIVLLTLGFSVSVPAYEYQVSCHEKKLTKFENVTVNQNTDECRAFLSNGYLSCFDSKKANGSSDLITLSTPNDHYYKSKESSKYSRKRVQEIIDGAIKAGSDPYLTLAIVMTENPPIVSNRKVIDGLSSSESYASDYGNVPLDAIAVADTMGCDRQTNGYDSNGMVQVNNRSSRLKKFIDNPQGKDNIFCMENRITAGVSAQFFLTDKAREDDCCVVLKSNLSDFVHEPVREPADQVYSYPNRQLRARILDLLAHKYMQNRFQSAQQRAAGLRNPEEKMAMVAQSFNGFGKFGVSEPMNNQCLHKLHMGTTPVYGAGTSEIMMNSLMNNSEIQDIVSDSLKANKVAHAESYICAAYGSGTHKVSGYTFTNLLGNYLGDRKTCPQYTNKLKNLSKFVKVQPELASPTTVSPRNDAEKNSSGGSAN